MEKRKTTIIFVIGVILIVSTFLICHKHTAYQIQLDEVKLKDIKDNNMFAIMVKESGGEYKSRDQFPGDGYKFNNEKSGCMDNNNKLIPDSLSFDEKEQKVIVNTGQTSYCYLYFDKQISVDDIRKDESGLSNELVGGMYRYQGKGTKNGNEVKNYICLKEVGQANCTSGSNDMYRIIGITPEGNIKVIKQTRYDKNGKTEFVWNTKYNTMVADSTYKCEASGCPEWPDVEIYAVLNTDFYNSLDSEIQNKIEEWEYMYGDIGEALIDYDHITAEQAFQIEIGRNITKYYNASGTYITDQKWTKSKKSNIALMYIHDYAYSGSTTGCNTSRYSDYSTCKSSWMYETNNDSATYTEWTMTRLGPRDPGNGDNGYGEWAVQSSGYVYSTYLNLETSVRPVFYLKNDITLEGEGTTENPFYIAK